MSTTRSETIAAGVTVPWRVLLVGLVVVGGIALRLPRLHEGLWMDEGISVTFVSEARGLADLLSALSATDQSERLQQLYVVLLYYWCAAFGDSTPVLRLFSLLPGLASIALLADAARRLWGAREAVWAAVLASGSAYLSYYSMEIRTTAWLVFFVAVFMDGLAADRRAQRVHIGATVCCCVAAALLCLGSIYSYLPLAALGLADARLRQAPVRWLRFWIPIGLAGTLVLAVLYLPVLLTGDVRTYAGVVHSQGLLQSILFVVYGISVGQAYGPPLEALHGADRAHLLLRFAPQLLAYAGVCAILLVGIGRTARRGGRAGPLTDLLTAFVVATLLGAATGWAQDLNWLPRHAFYLAPLLVLILSAAAANTMWFGAVPATALIAMNVVSVYNANFKTAYALDDYLSVAQYLRSAEADGATPVMLSGNLKLLRDYYGISPLANGRDIRPPTIDALLPGVSENAKQVEVVLNREFWWVGGADKTLPEVYDGALYTIDRHVHFVYFDLYRMTRK
jgi:hypothetical protein